MILAIIDATYSKNVAVSNLTMLSPLIIVCNAIAVGTWLYASPLGVATTPPIPSAVIPIITVLFLTEEKVRSKSYSTLT